MVERGSAAVPVPEVRSVNVGAPRDTMWRGRAVRSAIWKAPVTGPVAATGANLAGDVQADQRVHGGDRKAVYAYASEDVAWWEHELGRTLGPAAFGENLTTAGLDLSEARVGDRWRVGGALLEVTQPRLPCFKLGMKMNDPQFSVRFTEAGRPGAYLRIVEPGVINGGDAIVVEQRGSGASMRKEFRARLRVNGAEDDSV